MRKHIIIPCWFAACLLYGIFMHTVQLVRPHERPLRVILDRFRGGYG
jgi:hypothetical protein